jgi:hypothetical protein
MSEIFFGKSKSLDRFLQWAADHKVALHYMRRQAGTQRWVPTCAGTNGVCADSMNSSRPTARG